jgi:hypothetical protein
VNNELVTILTSWPHESKFFDVTDASPFILNVRLFFQKVSGGTKEIYTKILS